MKIAFFDTKSYDKASFDKFSSDELEFKYYETKLNPDTARLAEGCDCVCIFVNDVLNAEVIDKLYSLGVKAVALRCAGYNNVDLNYARGKIAIFNVPAYSPFAVAEHAMAMLLTFVRKTHKAYIRTKDHNFSLSGLTGVDLNGKTVGIIGTGRIGKCFANICKGFGMNILAFDKYPDQALNLEYVSLDRLFKESDIISLHCPLTEETRHIINETTLENLKKGVIIINTSRGALIDSDILLKGIKSRHIGGACLDVYEEESEVFFEDRSQNIMDDDTLARLISMPNVLVTSHQAFLTQEALNNIAETTTLNITEFFKNGDCKNLLC
ncbi:MAG: 2-hydroxyacid dehydrogenase [Ruminococcaceae bacterium]|nr:2-hydroxyacid dehydrogenase [Oscillospiraceae bacterium]